MRGTWKEAAVKARPYLTALLGVAAITAAIALFVRQVTVPNLSVLYVLLVLWVGSRYGRTPALVASLLAFVAYDYFLVPPVGTLTVAGPSELLELVVLLAAALVTGQLVANLNKARAAAEAAAAESRELYELGTAALRSPEVSSALDLLCQRAMLLPGVASFGLLAFDDGVPQPGGGERPSPDELRQARWAFTHRRPIGCAMRDGRLTLMAARPPREWDLMVLPLTSGVVVAHFLEKGMDPKQLRMLAALVALAELLLERRRAIVESDRRRAAEASNSLKTAILSSLSHELKSPIASLRAGITVLASPHSEVSSDQRAILGGLDHQAQRLDRLVGDLLTMSRLEAGGKPELDARLLPEILGGVLHRMRNQLARFKLELKVEAELPAVNADELQIDRVLTNLVENAIDWTAEGGRIEIGATLRGTELAVWVANDGESIPYVELDHVFDKFWTKRESGSGLGLAICKGIVEAHGGTIAARNLRRGPEFTFTLPLAPVASPST